MGNTYCRIVDPVTGAPINLSASLEKCYMVIATQIYTTTIDRADVQHTVADKQPFLLNAQSYAIGLHMVTNATAGQIHEISVKGNPRTNSSLKTT